MPKLADFLLRERPIKKWLRETLPKPLWHSCGTTFYRLLGRRSYPQGETAKAQNRRIKEGFFEKYCRGKGLDIGYGGNLLSRNCRGWDFEHGDAQYLLGLKDATFDFVYSSHCLEHMVDVQVALRNWWRVLKSGGHLILFVPHRDLYERKKTLPSHWNLDHKRFFLVDKDDPPDTVGIMPLIQRTFSNSEIIYAKECSGGYGVNRDGYPEGEYSIEVVVKKGLV